MARKTKLESEKTRNKIIDAAEDIFHEKGVSKTSLCEIADHAGVTRGAIYWHFKNKLDLFSAMHKRAALPLEDIRAETLNKEDSIVCLKDFWIRSILQVINDDARWRVIEIIMMRCEYVENFGDAAKRMREWNSLLIDSMTEVFEDAKEKKLLINSISPKFASVMTCSFVTGIIYNAMLREDKKEMAGIISEVMGLFFSTLRNPTSEGQP